MGIGEEERLVFKLYLTETCEPIRDECFHEIEHKELQASVNVAKTFF